MSEQVRYSVVLPCYNESGNIDAMVAELRAALEPTGEPFEIIFVDDASTDGSTEKLRAVAAKLAFVRHVRHGTNLGQSAAILSGYEVARGDIVITMDADLQNDPADIPAMLSLMAESGADAVLGVRARRRDSWSKRQMAKWANRIRGGLLGDGLTDAGCTFRVVRRECLVQLIAFKALHRFLPTLLKLHGFRVVEMPINHRPRTSGVSKYGFGNRAFVGILDIIGMMWYRKRRLPVDKRVDEG